MIQSLYINLTHNMYMSASWLPPFRQSTLWQAITHPSAEDSTAEIPNLYMRSRIMEYMPKLRQEQIALHGRGLAPRVYEAWRGDARNLDGIRREWERIFGDSIPQESYQLLLEKMEGITEWVNGKLRPQLEDRGLRALYYFTYTQRAYVEYVKRSLY